MNWCLWLHSGLLLSEMARGKGKAKPSEKLSKELAIVAQPSKPTHDDDPPFEGELLMADAGAGSGPKKRAKKRTREEVFNDNTTKWVERMEERPAKNERQVDPISLEEKLSVPEIRREGLEGWFEPLPGTISSAQESSIKMCR